MDIIVDINRLSNKLDLNEDEKAKLAKCQFGLHDIYSDKAKGTFIRSKAEWTNVEKT
jgi:hypothetical protein